MTGRSPCQLPLEHDAHDGRLYLNGHPYLLIRPQTLGPLCKSRDEAVVRALFEGGREGGTRAAESVLRTGGSPREALTQLMVMGGAIGWGRFRLVEFGAERVVVEVAASPFAEAAAGSDAPACHLIRGVLAGVVARIDGREVAAEETLCAARGDPVCRFELVR